MKSKKTRKIVSISIISLVVALTIVVVLLAVIPKKHYDPMNWDYDSATIYKDKSNAMLDKDDPEDKKVLEKIKELYEKSLKDSILSSMFQGTGSYSASVKEKATSVSDLYDKSGVTSIVFDYDEEQVLQMYGEEYMHQLPASASKQIKYYSAVLVLTDTTSFEEATLYLITNVDKSKSEYCIKFLAHQSELYDYISDYSDVIYS